MTARRRRAAFSGLGCGAVIVAVAVSFTHDSGGAVTNTAGRGDQATTTVFSSPTVPAVVTSPTAMSTGATQNPAAPPSTVATSKASPPLSIAPAATCVLNGVALPGGCH